MAERSQLSAPSLGGLGLPWLVLAFCLAVTAISWRQAETSVRADADLYFDRRAIDVAQEITSRMRAYEQVLRGGVGLFHASEQVDLPAWEAYTRSLRLAEDYPGFQGVGFAKWLGPESVAELESRMRAEGYLGARVWTEGDVPARSAILYLEPFDWRNQRALGYDMFSEPTRRAAMEAARDTGEVRISGRITLVQETETGVQAGFNMYAPLYSTPETPATVEERRRQLHGFVYSPFRMNDLMAGVLGPGVSDVSLRVYDGDPEVGDLLYDDGGPAPETRQFTATRDIPMNGRVWTMVLTSRRALEAELADPRPLLILLGGGAISLLLFGVVWSVGRTSRRALQLARDMTVELRESEARFSSLVEAATDAIALADQERGIIVWNRSAERMFGFSGEDMRGKPLSRVLPDLPLTGASAPGRVLPMRARRADGSRFPAELAVSEWSVNDRRYTAVIVRDVTAREQAEAALRLAEQRFRIALQPSDISVFNQDRELRYTWLYNPPLSLPESHFLGRTDDEIGVDPKLVALKRLVLTSGRGVHRELDIQAGRRRAYFDIVLEPLRENGRVVGLTGAAVNITPLKQAEQELRRSEARFRATFENAGVGIAITDLEGRVLNVNPAFVRMLGYAAEELVGMTPANYVHPDDIAEKEADFSALVKQVRTAMKRRVRYLRKDGGVVWGSVTVSLVYDQGRPVLAVRMVEDVTELEAAESALKAAYRDLERRVDERTRELREQAQELARSNADLEQFAYVASHDLQEPLRTVSTFAQLLERRYGDALSGDGKAFLGYIVDGTHRMRELIVDLLAYSRVGAQRKPFTVVSTERVLAAAEQNLAARIAERKAEVRHSGLPEVWGDEGELQQLFQNLIGNALKFNRAESPKVWVDAVRRGGEWEFSVRDNGIGIDPRDFGRVFSIFQRAHRRDEFGGTGIGLAICKKVVDRHQGRIWLESTPGEGTTFYFTLKAPPAEGGDPEPA